MQTIEASFEIVTPMFIGGGNPNDVELRPPSIKGALRFWWRALQWGQCLQGRTSQAALAELYKQEAEMFGAAVKDDKYGQGKLQIRLEKFLGNPELPSLSKYDDISSGQTYLLGQGLYHFRNGFLKKALYADQSFTIRLTLSDDVEPETVLNTLLIWGLLGGLGSRSRRGWGSVAIRSLIYKKNLGEKEGVAIEIPNSIDAYKTRLQELLTNKAPTLPPFTAFSSETRIDLSKTGNNALNLLGEVGLEMQMYRSYGKKDHSGIHKVAGKKAEPTFAKSDHDVVLFDFAQERIPINTITNPPKRVIFGLPHNYFFADKTKVDVIAIDTKIPINKKKERQHRRASPLFIHIHKFGSGECIAVQSLLEADFLPATYKIQLENTTKNSKKKGTTVELPCTINWADITDYLNRFFR